VLRSAREISVFENIAISKNKKQPNRQSISPAELDYPEPTALEPLKPGVQLLFL
jgi:hypothetical protein